MKFKLKHISMILVVVAIGLLAGCTVDEGQVNDEVIFEDLSLATGYIQSKSEEDGINFIEFSLEGENLEDETLKLEVVDEDLFNSVEEDGFYLYSYNEDYILRNVQGNSYLRDLLEDNMDDEEDLDHNEDDSQEIVAEDIISLEGLTLLDEYIFDFNNDDYEETIAMYVEAERGPDGEIMWDDGQRWVLVVHGDDEDYVLYDDYVQIGSIQFNVFTEDDDFYIVTKSVRTASLTVSQYLYNEDADSFIETVAYSVDGNVNMLHSSN